MSQLKFRVPNSEFQIFQIPNTEFRSTAFDENHFCSDECREAFLKKPVKYAFLPLVVMAILPASRLHSRAADAHPVLQSGSYELHPDFELSLFAAEPDVVDPVALTFDEQGRMFVVEMRDYPDGMDRKGKPGGTIRLLEDTDGDGKADRSVLFAANLSFPTSIAPWKGGVVVTAPPEVVYLKDTDGDGRADYREVLLSGFHLGVTDSNVNGLRWGLDNRLHGVNGGNDGIIKSSRRPGLAPVSLRKLDFSFDPETGDFSTTTHTSGGFGLVFDDWGHSFGTYNINHIQQRIIPVRYLQRFPGLAPVEGVTSISDHGDMARIFPVSEPETRPNHPEQSGHFSAAGGMGFAAASGLPGGVSGSVFVCDVVGHVVHRDVLEEDGPIFTAKRPPNEQTNEFFAARDPAFRPVGMEAGPDGALYLLDMQRDVIEHPDYIPEITMARLNVRAGEDRGRIYRLSPGKRRPFRPPNMRSMSSAELIGLLGHSNQWWRMTAQRLLVERQDGGILPRLKERVSTKDALERMHVYWTLRGLGGLEERLLNEALADRHPGVRENALILAERFLPASVSLQERVVNLVEDPSPRVRFQAALSLGEMDSPSARTALAGLFRRDVQHRWTRVAVLCSLHTGETDLLISLLTNSTFRGERDSQKLAALHELADLCGARSAGPSNSLAKLLANLGSKQAGPDIECRLAVLNGLHDGLKRVTAGTAGGNADIANALQPFLQDDSPEVLTAAWRLARVLGLPDSTAQRMALTRAMKIATDPAAPVDRRVGQVRLLSFGEYSNVGDSLISLLTDAEPAEIQTAAVTALSGFSDREMAIRLLGRWRVLQPSVRSQVLGLLLQRTAFHDALLSALEAGKLSLGELNLDLEQRRRLLRKSSPEITARAAKWIGDGEYSNRKHLVGEWLAKLPTTGSADRGHPVFARLCASCHSAEGKERSVGPNLASVAHRSVEDLVSNILDPNMAINPSYVTYTVETTDDESLSGVLQSESPESVILLQAMGRQLVIQRKDIKEMRSTGLSLMPEGLEAGMSPADLRDLVAYLQSLR